MPNSEGGSAFDEKVAAAWQRVVVDCGCPDLYYCPPADEIECPRHSGFTACCAQPLAHISVR
jgi:hypothetical protein